ncbi:MAG TPA: transketolase [Anaerolineales bacterium]|nr:transketolase [Anaerolineales bacterium]
MNSSALDQLSINTIRFLAADMVQNANSGHPGLPMGAAPMAYSLWQYSLKHNPANPGWFDRDRFVLSAGHGSALLYALLHLTGYALPLEELKRFRQWGSRTPGHPEVHLTPGVETTTGPLGQGLSNAVGMAIAEAHLAAEFNRPGHPIVDHFTYVLCGDGDLMEGVTSEACSLAGHLRLGKLIALYDDNRISLAGSTSIAFTEDVGARFAAYGWHVQQVEDGNDIAAVDRAIQAAREATDRPSIILVRTHIGYGAPHKQDTFEAHGSPLGPDELKAAKEKLGWPVEPAFLIPGEAQENLRQALSRGQEWEADWNKRFAAYSKAHPDLAAEFERRLAGDLPDGWDGDLPVFPADPKGLATRKAGETVLQHLAARLPELIGGSADLDPSTFTWLKGAGDFESPERTREGAQGTVGGPWGYEGRNLHFGVREHGMGAIVNGLTLHGGLRGYGSTFFVFTDYMRPAIRLSAIMEVPSLWVYTHDSVAVGEDGPTHQPVEHLAALRAIPGLVTIRPCDANETTWAWKAAVENRGGPTALVLSRQNVPTLDRSKFASAEGLLKGAYVLNPQEKNPDLILMATGSEVSLIVAAADLLATDGVHARLVSMPSWDLFLRQPEAYRQEVLPVSVKARLAVEAGVSLGWREWVGDAGGLLTLDRYGASAPAGTVLKELGFTTETVAARAREILKKA